MNSFYVRTDPTFDGFHVLLELADPLLCALQGILRLEFPLCQLGLEAFKLGFKVSDLILMEIFLKPVYIVRVLKRVDSGGELGQVVSQLEVQDFAVLRNFW